MAPGADSPSVPVLAMDEGIEWRGFGPHRFAGLPLPVLFVAAIGLWFRDIQAPHEPLGLLIALNLLLATLPAMVIAYLFARTFLITGAPGMALFGCGALIWSVSGIYPLAASLAPGSGFNLNAFVTVHIVSVWGASLCFLAGGVLFQQRHRALLHPERALASAYALAVAVAAFMVFMALKEWTPVFFIEGKGGSDDRRFVLGSAIFTILLTLSLLRGGSPRRTPFLDWFVLAQLLLVIGYASLMLQSNFGGGLSWVCRAAQFLGGGYMLAAAYAAFRDANAPFGVLGPSQDNAPRHYSIAVALVLAAAVLRLVFLQALETHASLIAFYPAVMLAAFSGGLRAGTLATFLSAALAGFFRMEPDGSFVVEYPPDWLALAVFVIVSLLISWIVERLQQAQSRLHRAEVERRAELERMVTKRTAELSLAKDEAERANHAKSHLFRELQAVYDYAPIGLCVIDAQMRWRRINAVLAEINGFPPEAHAGRRVREMLPNIAGAIEPVLRRVIETGEPSLGIEVIGETPARPGAIRAWQLDCWPMCDETGTVASLNVVVQEVTKEREAARALAASEERFRTLFETMSEGFAINEIVCDEAGKPSDFRYLSVNPAFERHTGLKPADIIGRTARELFPDAEQMWFERYGKVALTGEPAHFEGQFGPLGRWFEVRVYQTQPGRFAVVFFDITARKRAEVALRESQQRQEGLIQSAMDAIIAVDASQRIVLFNPAAERMFGCPAGEALGDSLDRFIPERFRQAHRDHVRVFGATGATSHKLGSPRLVWGLHQNGEDFSIEASISRQDAGGERLCTVILRDITERKRHEEHAQLLMREVNHRAKNMLAVVQSIARQTAATKPEDFIGRFGERIQALSKSQDLLVQTEWKGVDIVALVHSQLAHFKELIGTRISLKGPSLLISAAAAQTIGMALHELCTNASKFGALSNGDGRVEVSWSLECAGNEEEGFEMSWREDGGPAVTAPAKSGFGSIVIQRLAKESLDAEIDLDFAARGLFWRLQCPVREVVDGRRSLAAE